MKTRLFAILLCVVIAFSILPTKTLAMIGAVTHVDDIRHKTVTVNNPPPGFYTASTPAGVYYMLYNDYLCFILRPDGCTTTVPTRLYKAYIDSMSGSEYTDETGSIIKNFPVTEQYQYNYAQYIASEHRKYSDSPAPHSVEIGTDSLIAHYDVGGNVIASTIEYSLVKVDNGATQGHLPISIVADEEDNGRCWGIKMNVFMKYNENQWYFPDNEDYRENGVKVELVTTHLRFAKQSELKEGGLLELSYSDPNYYGNELVRSHILSTRKISRVDIPYSDISILDNGHFISATEAFTSSFGSNNQFVALGASYFQEVEGHSSNFSYDTGGAYADHYSYNSLCAFPNFNGSSMYFGSTFTTYSSENFFIESGLGTGEHSLEATANGMWGFRDMYTGNEYDIPEDPDYE